MDAHSNSFQRFSGLGVVCAQSYALQELLHDRDRLCGLIGYL